MPVALRMPLDCINAMLIVHHEEYHFYSHYAQFFLSGIIGGDKTFARVLYSGDLNHHLCSAVVRPKVGRLANKKPLSNSA
jgi:hypothetical protein